MPWSLIVGLLIRFLLQWLESLLKEKAQFGHQLSADAVAQHREHFLKGVKARFWIGKHRMEAAEKAFDLMLANMNDHKNKADIDSDYQAGNYKLLAVIACKGIEEKLS